MGQGDWTTPVTIISIWSAVAGTIASFIAWRVFRWQRQSDIPIINCEIEKDGPEWLVMRVIVRNVTDTVWKSEQTRIVSPKSARGISEQCIPLDQNRMNPSPDFVAARHLASRIFGMEAQVAAAGTPRHQYLGGGDVSYERIYVLRSSITGKKLSMRLSLASMDAVERRITVAIKRQLPAAAKTAND